MHYASWSHKVRLVSSAHAHATSQMYQTWYSISKLEEYICIQEKSTWKYPVTLTYGDLAQCDSACEVECFLPVFSLRYICTSGKSGVLIQLKLQILATTFLTVSNVQYRAPSRLFPLETDRMCAYRWTGNSCCKVSWKVHFSFSLHFFFQISSSVTRSQLITFPFLVFMLAFSGVVVQFYHAKTQGLHRE